MDKASIGILMDKASKIFKLIIQILIIIILLIITFQLTVGGGVRVYLLNYLINAYR